VTYQQQIVDASEAIGQFPETWSGIEAESVARMRLQPEPFEKTPTQKIKRHVYPLRMD